MRTITQCFGLLAIVLQVQFPAQIRAQDVYTTLRLSASQEPAKFKLGQRVEVKLTFKPAGNSALKFDPMTGPRDKTSNLEIYSLDSSADAVDPYMKIEELGFVKSESRFNISLSPLNRPITIVQDLNQYLRFSRPGTYTIRVKSTRVYKKNGNGTEGGAWTDLLSSALTIILEPADAEWIGLKTTDLSRTLLDSGLLDPNYTPVYELSYLNNVQAIPVLLKGYEYSQTKGCQSAFYEALLETSHSDEVTKGLEKLLKDPESTIPVDTVFLLATKSVAKKFELQPLSTLPPHSKLLDEAAAARNSSFNELTLHYVSILKATLSRRSEKSRVEARAASEFVGHPI